MHTTHDTDVQRIQADVMRLTEQGKKIKIFHGSTNSTRKQHFDAGTYVDTSSLNRVLEINTESRLAIVEPNVSMDALVEATLAYGFVPEVVPEFPGITVGGAIQGGAGESSSFKFGLFNETCIEYELVLGDGRRVIASQSMNSDLYYGTACSYGTLGIVTRATIRLVPAQEFVRLRYHRINTVEDAIAYTKECTGGRAQFLDGIQFEDGRGVVMSGVFSDIIPLPISQFTRARDEWFYIHADRISKMYTEYEELVPIRDYLFRYDRGGFWMGAYGFQILRVPFTRATRFLFDWFCHTRELYKSLHNAEFSQRFIIQDIAVPYTNAVDLMRYVARVLKIYPIWFVPVRTAQHERLAASYLDTPLVISVGIWGESSKDPKRALMTNQSLERKLMRLGGRKWLYAHQYFTTEEFWHIYGSQWYQALRTTYAASSAFPDVYEKTKVTGTYNPSILKGIWKNFKSTFSIS